MVPDTKSAQETKIHFVMYQLSEPFTESEHYNIKYLLQ